MSINPSVCSMGYFMCEFYVSLMAILRAPTFLLQIKIFQPFSFLSHPSFSFLCIPYHSFTKNQSFVFVFNILISSHSFPIFLNLFISLHSFSILPFFPTIFSKDAALLFDLLKMRIKGYLLVQAYINWSSGKDFSKFISHGWLTHPIRDLDRVINTTKPVSYTHLTLPTNREV